MNSSRRTARPLAVLAILIALGAAVIVQPASSAAGAELTPPSPVIYLPPSTDALGASHPGAGARRAAPAAQEPAPALDPAAAVAEYFARHPVPQQLWIDKLKVKATIQPVGPGQSVGQGAVEWSAPKNRNVGWHDYSGRMGEGRNIVLNGHNNIYGAVFRKLYTLQPGDELRLGAGDAVATYRVVEVLILKERGEPLDVRIQNAAYIQPMNDDRLTLVSCWPENNNTHRVIVVARPVVAAQTN